MNPYFYEMLARERQDEMLREAERRRLVAVGRAQQAGRRGHIPGFGLLAAIADALRTSVVPGNEARIEHPGLGDAS